MDELTAERWLPVVGWEDLYLVSSWARVRSLPRVTRDGKHLNGQVLKASIGPNGYPMVSLCRDGRAVKRTVHSLVAEAFIGPRPEGQEVRHLDGVRIRCSPENLAYGTSSQNQIDKVEHGTHHYANRDECKNNHLLEGANLIIRLAPDGSFKQRVCVQCREDRKAASVASKPPCHCGLPLFAKGLCQKHYVQQRTAARRTDAQYEIT